MTKDERIDECCDALNDLTPADISNVTNAQMDAWIDAWRVYMKTGQWAQGIQHPPRKPPI